MLLSVNNLVCLMCLWCTKYDSMIDFANLVSVYVSANVCMCDVT